ncbi:MAG: SAM-dependent methyltransferase [Polyangiaceae bacterium]
MKADVISDVSDTARWAAHLRALESERPQPLFRDPYARLLAGERGRLVAEGLPDGPLAWSLAVRTRSFDELIVRAVRDHAAHTVLNLAAGLDTRPYRLTLPASLRWIEVDQASIIEPKNALLPRERASCQLERVALDLRDVSARQALFSRINRESSRVLVVTEGFLLYLDEAEVGALADDLHSGFPSALWLLELVSPDVLAQLQEHWGKPLAAHTPLQFAPAQGLAFFDQHGFVPLVERSLFDEAERFGREMRAITLVRWLSLVVPSIKRGLSARRAQFRDAVVFALIQQRTD